MEDDQQAHAHEAPAKSGGGWPEVKAPAHFKAIVQIGVSGAGKSEWAKAFIGERKERGERWLMLCRDDMRLATLREAGLEGAELSAAAKSWSYAFANPEEAKVHGRWLGRAKWAIEQGFAGVVCADTNLDGGRSATSALVAKLGVDPANIRRKVVDASFEQAVARDAEKDFSVGADEIVKQLHQLGRSLSLRKALGKAPATAAWVGDPANGFQTPKSLLPKAEKPAKVAKEPRAAKPKAPKP